MIRRRSINRAINAEIPADQRLHDGFGWRRYRPREAVRLRIILLDLNLPDMLGFDVLRTLRASKVEAPILILSGLAGIKDKCNGLGFGADDYMTKRRRPGRPPSQPISEKSRK